MKARAWLVEKGLAKDGRGKFSNQAKIELDNAVAAGQKFEDWPKGENAPVNKTNVAKAGKVEDSSERFSDYLYPSDFAWPEGEYKAMAGKKEYSMREVCNNCRVSLVMCQCGSPTIHGGIVVEIVTM